MAQQVALQKKQLAEANNKVPMSLKAVAEKYKVQPVVAEKASQMNVLALGRFGYGCCFYKSSRSFSTYVY